MQDNLKMKEYLVPQEDGTYKLQLVDPLTDLKSWIEVPKGATIFAINDDVKTFYKDDGNTQFDDVEWKPCDGVGLVVYNNLKTFLRFGEGGKVVWERQNDVEEPMTEDNQIVIDRSDLFDKIRKGEISFDFSEMKTEREGNVVERILGVQVDEFSAVDDKQVDWLKQRVEGGCENGKAVIVTVTPNDIKAKWFKKFLDGVKVQYRVMGSKGWQNMTWKSLEMMKLNIEFREKPTTVEVDGMKFDTVDKLTSYLKSMTNLK